MPSTEPGAARTPPRGPLSSAPMGEPLPNAANSGDATRLLLSAAAGDKAAADQLLPLVYDQLRRAAQRELSGERPGHTLQATALVHEAYLRLVGEREVPWDGRAHFYKAAAEAMRRILLDHARTRGRLKRGGGRGKVDLEVGLTIASSPGNDQLADCLAIDEALQRLETRDPRAANVVRLRFYAGLEIAQVAEALGISERTVRNDWAFARAWLARELDGRRTGGDGGDKGGPE